MSTSPENLTRTDSERIFPEPAPVYSTQPAAEPKMMAQFDALQAGLGNSLVSAAATSGPPPDPLRIKNLYQTYSNAALSHSLIQRKADGHGDPEPANAAPAATTGPAATSPAAQPATPLIVEDNAETLLPGQIKKTEFLTELRNAVSAATSEALAGTPWSLAGSAYINRGFAQYATMDSQRLERTIRLHAPEVATTTSAAGLILLITARVRRSLTIWATTGQLSGVPAGLQMDLPGAGLLAGVAGAASTAMSAVSGAASSVVSGVRNAASAVGNLLFKERTDGARETSDPQTIQSELGPGHALDGPVRSSMESAFGQGFSDVQVHADANAAGLSENLNARAFTVGQHIAFGTGEYQPGTLIGDALIAHELAHVMQQRGADSYPAQKGPAEHGELEDDADRAAVGAVVSTWAGAKKGLAKISERAMPSLKSGLRLQRCGADVPIPAEYQRIPTIRPDDEALLSRLEGHHHVYATYRAYTQAVNSQARLASCAGDSPMALGGALGSIPSINALRRQLDDELHEEGFASFEEFVTKIGEFEGFFQRYALQTGFQILQENENLIKAESNRYSPSGASAGGGLSELRTALQPVKEKIETADRIPAVAHRESDGLGHGLVYMPAPETIRLHEEAERMARAMAPRFPILADPELNIRALVAADDEKLRSLLQSTASDRLSDIQKTRQNLVKDPGLIWQMEAAVERARLTLGIVQGSIYDGIIEDKLHAITIDKVFRSLLIGALAIGLGLISAGTGTVAVLAGAALAGVSVGILAAHTQEFLIQQAAAGTSFDRARALTAHEPSLGWLALDLAAAILDVGAALSAFNSLRTTAKAVVEGTASLNNLRREALAVGGELADAKKIADPAAFADGVAAAAERAQRGRRLLEASPEAANAIRQAAAGLDETAVMGILRLSPEARAVVLTEFAGNAGLLGRLGAMAEQSEHVVTAVNMLRRNMTETQFKVVIEHYLKARDIDSVARLLRAIGEAGVDDQAISAISASMGRVRSEGGIITKFTPQIHDAIAGAIGPGPAGIRKLLQVTEGLHPNQSGTIFENWVTRYVYGGTRERASIDTARLTGPYRRNPMTSDNWLAANGGSIVVDFKHLRSGERFSGSAATQLEDYGRLLRDGAAYRGTRITQVEYLFSTLEAAQANAARIREVLGTNVTIKYIDLVSGTPVILP